jgi:hypothetical protein
VLCIWNKPYYHRSFVRKIKAQAGRKVAAFCLALTVCSPRISSTTVIAFVRTDRITIAADAKSAITNAGGRFRFAQTCKIYQSGTSFFAFAGTDQDDAIGFISSDIAKKNITLSVKGRAEAFAEEAKGPLLKSIQRAHRVLPPDVYQIISPGGIPLVALFIGIEQGASVYQGVDMVEVDDASGQPIRIDTRMRGCPGDFCPGPGKTRPLWMGQNMVAQAEYERMRATHDPRLGDDVATLHHLIESEIAVHPDFVGPPIAVLTLDGSGSRWEINGKCGQPAQKPKVKSKPRKIVP